MNTIEVLKHAWQSNSFPYHQQGASENEAELYPYFAALQVLDCAHAAYNTEAIKVGTYQKALVYSVHPILTSKVFTAFQKNMEPIVSNAFLASVQNDNYFAAHQIKIAAEEVEHFIEEQKQLKNNLNINNAKPTDVISDDNQLMITRSFEDWLNYFKAKKESEQKEKESKESVRAMWQKEKLAAASEEENELIPENVFKMAIDSIHLSDKAVSESLAEILLKQGKNDKAAEMYRKLSLLHPEKSSYFAHKLKEISKN
jgi:tetratricopeptide (TPR) repeat protein